MTSGIYKIECLKNNRVYIGQSVKVSRRLGDHKKALKCGKHRVGLLQEDYDKYGVENFSFKCIVYCGVDKLDKIERSMIIGLDAIKNGYNSSVPVVKEYCNDSTIVKIYDAATRDELAIVNGIGKASRLIKVTPSKIESALSGKSSRPYSSYGYILLPEDITIQDYIDKVNSRGYERVYETDEELREYIVSRNRENAIKQRKKVGMFDVDGNLIEEFSHAGAVWEKYDKYKRSGVMKCLDGYRKHYKGVVFKRI